MFYIIFAVLIISDVTVMNLRCCVWKTTCGSDGRSIRNCYCISIPCKTI